MADIVNLRRLRKRKRREEAATEAEQSRIRHGRSKTERAASSLESGRAERALDGHRRDAAGLRAETRPQSQAARHDE